MGVLLLTGCGEGEGRSAPGYNEIRCKRLFECREEYGFPFDSLSACEAEHRCVESRFGPGRPASSSCLQALEAADCARLHAGPLPECRGEGNFAELRVGEVCDALKLCEEGSFCDWSGGACGICTPKLPAGESCTFSSECESGSCDGRTCVALAPIGERCAVDEQCEAEYCEDGTCEAPRPDGSSCTENRECESLRCEAGACEALRPPRIGDACDDDADCSFWCSRELCHATALICVEGACRDLPGKNAPCTEACRYGYVCIAGRCESEPSCGAGRAGEPCRPPNTCADGFVCVPSRDAGSAVGTCTALAKPGEACLGNSLSNGGCSTESYCDLAGSTGVCRHVKSNGERCSAWFECESRYCADGLCIASFCAAEE